MPKKVIQTELLLNQKNKQLKYNEQDMVSMRDINNISEGDRLFYELGFKLNIKLGVTGGNWIRTGKFKEVKDVKDMLVNDKRMVDIDYLEHHNFMLIKN